MKTPIDLDPTPSPNVMPFCSEGRGSDGAAWPRAGSFPRARGQAGKGGVAGEGTVLPPGFVERMSALLGDEAPAFFASFGDDVTVGLRVNTLKIAPERFRDLVPWDLEPVPWCPAGFTLADRDARPGRSPLHQAGLYYLQEPSAMAVAEALAPKPGDLVLDLSASPGGKATHLASLMEQRGVLIANDPVAGRIKPLGENLERWGARNVILTHATPAALASALPGGFDRVLVDAPCSGEGMFRKGPAALEAWSEEMVAGCAMRQERLLGDAAKLVRPGGFLLYSTCTFAPEENEIRIARFLEGHPEWTLVEIPKRYGLEPGRPAWAGPDGSDALTRMARLWPHRVRGEGHALALLHRSVNAPASAALGPPRTQGNRRGKHRSREAFLPAPPPEAHAAWERFREETLTDDPVTGALAFDGERLYAIPEGGPTLTGVRVVRPGLWLGSVRPGRFEPSHALALTLSAGSVANRLDLPEATARRYLAGEPIEAAGPPGWVLVTVEGWPLGWGRRSGRTVKNHYPKGLRRG